MAYRVFVSHDWSDRWVARQMARCISDAGAQPFVDIFDIEKGDRFEERIREELAECQELVALLTPWSVDRNWVWTEMASAWIMRKRLVPVLYGITLHEIGQLHGGLAHLSASNVCGIDEFDDYIRELRERTKTARA